MVGYVPVDRDRLEIQIYSAEIRVNKVASSLDYARLFSTVWASSPTEMKEDGINRGDVFASAGSGTGFDRFERIGVWRRGSQLLVIRALYDRDHAAKAESMIAPFWGSLRFETTLDDPVEASFLPATLPVPSSTSLKFRIPANWKTYRKENNPNKQSSASIFTNAADEDSNSSVAVFSFSTEKIGVSPTDDQLRQFAATIVGIELENLLPKVGYDLKEETTYSLEGAETTGDQNHGFIDDVKLQGSEQKIRANTLLILKDQLLIVIASLCAYPSTPSAISTMIHTDFVTESITNDIRSQIK
jgi:hypothetical protein